MPLGIYSELYIEMSTIVRRTDSNDSIVPTFQSFQVPLNSLSPLPKKKEEKKQTFFNNISLLSYKVILKGSKKNFSVNLRKNEDVQSEPY